MGKQILITDFKKLHLGPRYHVATTRKKCPKMTNFAQKRLFWAIKSKNGPKSKFCFLQFLKNDPQLVSSHNWASQHHFCKSLSDFKILAKFSRNRHFYRKPPRKRGGKQIRRFCNFFSKSIHIWLVLTNLGPQKSFQL